jgi:DNA-binding transcriptional MerR regulator
MEDERRFTRIIIEGPQRVTWYSEQEAADYSRLDVTVIRQLQAASVLRGVDVVGETPRYSEEDVALLRRIRRMHHDLEVNLEGIEVILRLCARVQELERELEQYRKRDASA